LTVSQIKRTDGDLLMKRIGPCVAWPEVKYPMEENAKENEEAEARCLAEVEKVIKQK